MQIQAVNHDIAVPRGAGYRVSFHLVNSDTGVAMTLSGYSGLAQVRPDALSDTLLGEISTTSGDITIDETGGVVHLRFPAALTAAVLGEAAWDVLIFPPDDAEGPYQVAFGAFAAAPSVTRVPPGTP
ncbi:hypothetical protein [uncultured Thiodictyon sp.]|uniref:hypothetical protein n=1 Tax=uncultured Thiodictyon sp. TaxID=1846217 RepID=UPI0025E3AD44|nr:hypothetical protein [uncultured Thiodictyon sp.]